MRNRYADRSGRMNSATTVENFDGNTQGMNEYLGFPWTKRDELSIHDYSIYIVH
jgi:hypothetical protein